jgi:hypothetical protein
MYEKTVGDSSLLSIKSLCCSHARVSNHVALCVNVMDAPVLFFQYKDVEMSLQFVPAV